MRGAAPEGRFELLRPATLADATALLAHPGSRLVAGGTDLLPNLRRGIGAPRWLVDLTAVQGFGQIHEDTAGWRLGAGVTLAVLARHGGLAAAAPALAQAAAAVAGPAHRVAATLGGNLCQDTRCVFYNQSAWWREANGFCLKHGGSVCHVAPQGRRCHAAYAGDLAPALIALDARVVVRRLQSTRTLPVAELYRDDGAAHLTLEPGELVAEVQVPRPEPGSASGYRKMRARAAMDFALAGVAMSLRVERGRIAALDVGVSGTDPRPLRLAGTAELLGRIPDEEAGALLARLVSRQVSPMRSTVTAAHHRRLVAAVAARRLLAELAQEAQP